MLPALLLAALALPAEAAHWMKVHSLSPYREHWNAELVVADLAAALPKVEDAVAKEGGALTQPLALMAAGDGVQQVSFSVPAKGAKRLAKVLRKLGALSEPRAIPARLASDTLDLKEKLAALLKERTDHAAAYKNLPATAQAVDEIIAHLSDASAAARDDRAAVLWNLTVRRK